jgi:hypothetical protein
MDSETILIAEEDIVERVILLNIIQSYREWMKETDVLEVSCRAWVIHKSKINHLNDIDYAIAVYQNEVKGVFKVIEWSKDIIESGRWAFKGEIAPAPIHDKYIGKRIDAWKQGQAGPVIYLNV